MLKGRENRRLFLYIILALAAFILLALPCSVRAEGIILTQKRTLWVGDTVTDLVKVSAKGSVAKPKWYSSNTKVAVIDKKTGD